MSSIFFNLLCWLRFFSFQHHLSLGDPEEGSSRNCQESGGDGRSDGGSRDSVSSVHSPRSVMQLHLLHSRVTQPGVCQFVPSGRGQLSFIWFKFLETKNPNNVVASHILILPFFWSLSKTMSNKAVWHHSLDLFLNKDLGYLFARTNGLPFSSNVVCLAFDFWIGLWITFRLINLQKLDFCKGVLSNWYSSFIEFSSFSFDPLFSGSFLVPIFSALLPGYLHGCLDGEPSSEGRQGLQPKTLCHHIWPFQGNHDI